jgi:hypothetical protein
MSKYSVGSIIRGYYSDQEYRIIMLDGDGANTNYTVIPAELKFSYDPKDMKTMKENEIRLVVWTADHQRDTSYSMCTCGAKSVGHPSHAHHCKAVYWVIDEY